MRRDWLLKEIRSRRLLSSVSPNVPRELGDDDLKHGPSHTCHLCHHMPLHSQVTTEQDVPSPYLSSLGRRHYGSQAGHWGVRT